MTTDYATGRSVSFVEGRGFDARERPNRIGRRTRPTVDRVMASAALPLSLRVMTRGLGANQTQSPDALSMLLFERDYVARLLDIGRRDAERQHDRIAAFLKASACRSSSAGWRAVPLPGARGRTLSISELHAATATRSSLVSAWPFSLGSPVAASSGS
ncbi:MAG: hypothetical protein BRD44_05945 [Bacteroidetes bacterium QS_7_67_15]|nr:MAG: hypothetical protein BRD44_05945 [Bacteroidetes bacterium QS_7_67_15]